MNNGQTDWLNVVLAGIGVLIWAAIIILPIVGLVMWKLSQKIRREWREDEQRHTEMRDRVDDRIKRARGRMLP